MKPAKRTHTVKETSLLAALARTCPVLLLELRCAIVLLVTTKNQRLFVQNVVLTTTVFLGVIVVRHVQTTAHLPQGQNVAVASQGWSGGMGSARSALKTRLLLRTQSLVILVPPTQQQHLSQTTVTVPLGII